jgi:hypothetical protein
MGEQPKFTWGWCCLKYAASQRHAPARAHERTISKQSMPSILMDHPQNMQANLNYLVEKFSFPNLVSSLTFGSCELTSEQSR